METNAKGKTGVSRDYEKIMGPIHCLAVAQPPLGEQSVTLVEKRGIIMERRGVGTWREKENK